MNWSGLSLLGGPQDGMLLSHDTGCQKCQVLCWKVLSVSVISNRLEYVILTTLLAGTTLLSGKLIEGELLLKPRLH